MLFLIPSIISTVSTYVGYASEIKSLFEENAQNTILEQHTTMLSGIQTGLSLVSCTTVATLALSMVSLYKIHQISKDIKKISKDIKKVSTQIDSGFLDLKYFVQNQIEISFNKTQKIHLEEAYNYYLRAIQNIKRASTMKNLDIQNHTLVDSIKQLDTAFVIYNSRKDLNINNNVEQLKQLELIIAIEGLKSEVYFLLGEIETGKDHYSDLYKRVDKELKEISKMASEKTIDLILSDTMLIRNNDMKYINDVILKS